MTDGTERALLLLTEAICLGVRALTIDDRRSLSQKSALRTQAEKLGGMAMHEFERAMRKGNLI